MAESPSDCDQSSNDSDITYCPELDACPQSQKRLRKKSNLFQLKSSGIQRLEEMVQRIKSSSGWQKREAASRFLNQLKLFKAKNKGDQDAIRQLRETLISISLKPSRECNNYNHDTQAATYHMKAKDILNSMNKFDLSETLNASFNISTSDVLNCVNYDPFGDSSNSQNNCNAPQVCGDTIKDEKKQALQDISMNESLSDNFRRFLTFGNSHSVGLDSTREQSCNPGRYFDNTFHDTSEKCKDILIHSDVKIKPPELQQMSSSPLFCYNTTSMEKSAQLSYQDESSSQIKITDQKGDKRPAGINTQTTVHNSLDTQSSTEKPNQSMTDVDSDPSAEQKNKNISLQEALEMLEISKQKFISRLQARKQEILKRRTRQAVCKEEERNYLAGSSTTCIESKLPVCVTTVISQEELLRNMQFLYKVSAQYKRKYKKEGIDLFDD